MAQFIDLNGYTADTNLSGKLGWFRVIKPTGIHSKNVQEEARKLRKTSEVISVKGNEVTNRLASDCWEVDIVSSPEVHDEGDFMHQLNSGIDYVIAKACAEKGIAIELCFANVLNSFGRKRSQVLARMSQNIQICRDAKCDIVITSGAGNKYEMRAPRDLMALGIVLGMSLEEAEAAISSVPMRILKRTEMRNDPNVILDGLEVKKWASKPKEKKVSGWY